METEKGKIKTLATAMVEYQKRGDKHTSKKLLSAMGDSEKDSIENLKKQIRKFTEKCSYVNLSRHAQIEDIKISREGEQFLPGTRLVEFWIN